MPRRKYSANEVERVLDKKVHAGKVFYKLKRVGCDSPTWEPAKNCLCDKLIEEFEDELESKSRDEDEDEWEVEEIVGRRTRNNEREYLLKWKNWPGPPTWVRADQCECVNLIAAYENPKLAKMWNFDGTNRRLWLDGHEMLRYMKRFIRKSGYVANILEFAIEEPREERPPDLEEGINIGPIIHKNHWYLIIVLVNHICVTKRILIADPLNTLIGVPNATLHPVYMRMQRVFKSIPIKAIPMSPMERSDVCAFYVLAGFERALFLLQSSAKSIVGKIYFEESRAELIRSRVLPQSDGEISVSLPVNEQYLSGPRCEFCDKFFESYLFDLNEHIKREHFISGRDEKRIKSDGIALKRHQSTGDISKKIKKSSKKRLSS